jgi:hypothetical protein
VTEAVLELYADGWAKEDIAAHLQLPFQFVCEQLERDHAERYEDKHEDARRMNIKLQEMDRVLMLKIRARGRAGTLKQCSSRWNFKLNCGDCSHPPRQRLK